MPIQSKWSTIFIGWTVHVLSHDSKSSWTTINSKGIKDSFDARLCQSKEEPLQTVLPVCLILAMHITSLAHLWLFIPKVTLHHEPKGVGKHALHTGLKRKRYNLVKQAKLLGKV